MPSASRKEPVAVRAIEGDGRPARSRSTPWLGDAPQRRWRSARPSAGAKSKRWQRSTTVGRTFWASVVASTKIVEGGGSSSVLRNAFHACGREHVRLVQDVHLVPAADRRVGDASRSSRMSSTELFDAASISITSSEVAVGDRHARLARRRTARSSAPCRSSGTPRGSWPSTSCPCRASRRTARRGGPCPARPRCAACARRAPGRRRRRTSGGGGGGRAKGRRTRASQSRGDSGSARPEPRRRAGAHDVQPAAKESGPRTLVRSRFPESASGRWLRPGSPHRLVTTALGSSFRT